MKKSWIDAYQPRSWTLHRIDISFTTELDSLLAESGLEVCGGESQVAAAYWERTKSVENMLYFDMEQLLGMDLDRAYGVDRVGILTAEWQGHPAGSLVMSIYRGVRDTPPQLTVCVSEPEVRS